MALATSIYDVTRALSTRVFINGTLLVGATGHLTIRVAKSFASPVPVCSLELARIPSWVGRGQRVDVNMGFNEEYAKVFTGTVQARTRNPATKTSTIECAGALHKLFRTISINARDVDGLTVAQAIAGLLDYAGITDRALTIPAFTLGTGTGVTASLERAPISVMLQQLMDIDGLSVYELGSGTIVIRAIEDQPAPTAAFTYTVTSTPTMRILDGSDREDPSQFRDQIVFTGASITEGTPPSDTSRRITVTAISSNVGLVQPPQPAGTHIDAGFTNALVDTDAKAAEVAARLLTKYNRIPRRFDLEVPLNPLAELGQTVLLNFPDMEINNVRFWIESIEHRIDGGNAGAVTRFGLRGGEELGGTVQIAPIADFDYFSSQQVIGDRVYVIVQFIHRSFDPDGNIATVAWSDNQTTLPEINLSTSLTVGPRVRIDPAAVGGTWDVTLTVTDNDGLQASVTKTIPITVENLPPGQTAPFVVPALFAALDTNIAATGNGGEKWNDIATADSAISVGARLDDATQFGMALFGHTNGKLKRGLGYLASGAATLVSTLRSSVVDVLYDWRNPVVAWALTDDCGLYISTDSGVTWTLYFDGRAVTGMSSARGKRIWLPQQGGIIIVGGYDQGGGRPLVFYQITIPYGTWQTIPALAGELGADLPGPNGMNIVDFADKGNGKVLLLLENGSGNLQLYYTTNMLDNTLWKRASGLTAGLFTGRYVVSADGSDEWYCAFADRDVWAVDTSTGAPVCTKRANIMPAGVTPNDALWLYWPPTGLVNPGIYVVAAEIAAKNVGIYVSSDAFATAGNMGLIRPASGFSTWPANARGVRVAVGATIGRTGRIAYCVDLDGTAKAILYRRNEAKWHVTQIATLLSGCTIMKPRCTSPTTWFILGFNTATGYATSKCVRSANAGTSWATVAAPVANHFWQDIARANDGRLWGLTLKSTDLTETKVWYSDDDGVTWTLSTTLAAGSTARLCHLVCHPTNANRIAVFGFQGTTSVKTHFTVDRGATWTTNVVTTILASDQGHEVDASMLQNNRMVAVGILRQGTGVREIMTSDDNGISWQYRLNAGVSDHLLGPVSGTNSGKIFILRVSSTTTTIYVSTDQGTTWTALTPVVPRRTGTDVHRGGLAFDEREPGGAIYTAVAGGYTANDSLVSRQSPAQDAGIWNEFSDHALPIGAFTSYNILDYAQQIAVIPG